MPTIDSYLIDNDLIDGPTASNIKSIQTSTITLTGTTTDVTINSVDTSKTITEVQYYTLLGLPEKSLFVRSTLLNSTTVRLTINTLGSSSPTVILTVTEYNNVKSIQTGSVVKNPNVNSVSVAINNINTGKSKLFYDMSNDANFGYSTYQFVIAGIINSSTQILFNGYASTTNPTITINYKLIEFN